MLIFDSLNLNNKKFEIVLGNFYIIIIFLEYSKIIFIAFTISNINYLDFSYTSFDLNMLKLFIKIFSQISVFNNSINYFECLSNQFHD